MEDSGYERIWKVSSERRESNKHKYDNITRNQENVSKKEIPT